MNTAAEKFNPNLFTKVRKFISADSPAELERYSKVLYAHKIPYRLEPYSDMMDTQRVTCFSDPGFRVDIIMSYREIDETQILQWLGIKSTELYLYFDHS